MVVGRVGLVCFLVFCVVDFGSAWVFTDINYTMVENAFKDGYDDVENELTEEDMQFLKIHFIYPGTKWCGAGNIAENYDDLGSARETDMCCREHDNCPDLILAGETKHNLTNNAYYTRLSCGCDLKFRQCLHDANSSTANHIGKIYFNVLGTKCYKKDYPITGCKKRSGWIRRKCVKYEFDMDGKKATQWFDVPNY